MKIDKVVVNNRKKTLEIKTSKRQFALPFARLRLKPTTRNRVAKIYVDKELGFKAVTYLLQSGEEDSIHLDAFLDYNRDPDFLRDVTLHKLSIEAQKLFKKAGLSKQEVMRRMKTSAGQLYRLLDPANYNKTVDQMLKLIAVLGYAVDMSIHKLAA